MAVTARRGNRFPPDSGESIRNPWRRNCAGAWRHFVAENGNEARRQVVLSAGASVLPAVNGAMQAAWLSEEAAEIVVMSSGWRVRATIMAATPGMRILCALRRK